MATKTDQRTGTAPWRSATVSELQAEGILLVEDGNHGEYRPRPDEFVAQGTAFIRAADIDAGNILFGSASKISDVAVRRITKGIGSGGDVLLTHKGTVGKIAFAHEHAPPFVCSPQTTFWRTLNQSVLSGRYLYAFLRSPGFMRQLSARAGETDMAPYVSLTAQRTLTVVLPPSREQTAIATVLGALDDMIDLNRRTADTLEEMARALFKSWFVDFDPVHAKAAGKPPFGMTDATAALFPRRFQPSELGPIPQGWEQVPLGEALNLKRGYDLPKDKRRAGAFPICSSSGVSGWHAEAKASGPGVVTGRYGTVGQVFFMEEDYWPLNTTLYVSKFTRVLPRIAYYLLTGINFQTYADKAAVPGVNRNDVHREPIVLAPPPIQAQFDSAVEATLRAARTNRQQIATLSGLRDALLPKLLSGELRIKDAEKLVGETT